MKKAMRLLVCFSIVFSTISGITVKADMGTDMSNKGAIFVNNVEITSEDTIIISDNQMFIPLRTVLEALDATVVWEANTRNVYFDYAGVAYVCKFQDSLAQTYKFIQICTVESINSIYNSDYIQLNPMSADGVCYMINNRTCLNQQTGQRLLEALGCKVEIGECKQLMV